MKVAGPVSNIDLCAALLLLLIEAYAARLLLFRWRQGHRAEVALSVPAVFAVVVMLGAMIFIPTLEFQRSYKPFAALVRSEMAEGCKIALASDGEDHIGAFTFYLKSRLPIVRTPDEVRDFLSCSGPIQTGVIIIETNDLPRLLSNINPSDVRIVNVTYPGYKSAGFRLILSRPPDSP